MARFCWWMQHTGQEFVFLTDCLKCTLSHPKGSLFQTDFLAREGLSALRWITVPFSISELHVCTLPEQSCIDSKDGASRWVTMPDMFVFAYQYHRFLSDNLPIKIIAFQCPAYFKTVWRHAKSVGGTHKQRGALLTFKHSVTFPCLARLLLLLTLDFPCLLRKAIGGFFFLTNGRQAGHSCRAEFVVS